MPMVEKQLINLIGDGDPTKFGKLSIGLLWAFTRHFQSVGIEFEGACCVGSGAGEIIAYRKNKKTWGRVIGVYDAGVFDSETLVYYLSATNPIFIKQQTRNEFKIALGKPGLVNDALRETWKDFKNRTGQEMEDVRRKVGLNLKGFWRAVKHGDKSIVDRLGKIPSKKREQMRKRNMSVADEVPGPEQMDWVG